jgi:hypothetical protein
MLLGAGIAVVIANAGEAKIVSRPQPPAPTFSTLNCFDPDDLGRTSQNLMLDNGSIAVTGAGEPINEQTGEPFDGAGLYYEARATTPLPICMLGPQGAAYRPPGVTERVFVTYGDPPDWAEIVM